MRPKGDTMAPGNMHQEMQQASGFRFPRTRKNITVGVCTLPVPHPTLPFLIRMEQTFNLRHSNCDVISAYMTSKRPISFAKEHFFNLCYLESDSLVLKFIFRKTKGQVHLTLRHLQCVEISPTTPLKAL